MIKHLLKIIDNKIISGSYYTDRKTTGEIKNIKKIKQYLFKIWVT